MVILHLIDLFEDALQLAIGDQFSTSIYNFCYYSDWIVWCYHRVPAWGLHAEAMNPSRSRKASTPPCCMDRCPCNSPPANMAGPYRSSKTENLSCGATSSIALPVGISGGGYPPTSFRSCIHSPLTSLATAHRTRTCPHVRECSGSSKERPPLAAASINSSQHLPPPPALHRMPMDRCGGSPLAAHSQYRATGQQDRTDGPTLTH